MARSEILIARHELAPVQPGVLTIIAGLTGSGKSSIEHELLRQYPTMRKVISSTTRSKRAGEVDGVDYHFRDRNTFEEILTTGKMLEHVSYGGNLYGTETKALEPIFSGRDLIWIATMSRAVDLDSCFQRAFDTERAQTLMRNTLVIFIDVESIDDAERRFYARGGTGNFDPRIVEDLNYLLAYGNKFPNRIINKENELGKSVSLAADFIEQKRTELGLV